MSGNNLYLSDGSSVEADAVILATGWQPAETGIFDPALRAELGLPVTPDNVSEDEKAYWELLEREAAKQVLQMYPMLAAPPKDTQVAMNTKLHDASS